MNVHSKRNAAVSTGLLLAAMAVGGCEVVNPGQILDEDLSERGSLGVLVTGMAADFTDGLDDIAWNTSVMNGDLSGTSAYIQRQRHWEGRPTAEDADEYDSVHAARWVIDNGIQRMQTVLGPEFDSSILAAEAHLWGGFANRLLGETMCQAVIDGGSPQPRDVYFEAAEQHFTRAMEIAAASDAGAQATEIATAAAGGRASVRATLGDWSGAVTDAGLVPDDFVFFALFNESSSREMNTIWNESQSRVNLNVKYTFFEDYWEAEADPRARTFRDPDVPVSADGTTEHIMQGKYNAWGADIPLTKGAEMRLIEAEALIRDGQWSEGMDIINALRADAGVSERTATSQAEALDALKRERAVVLWLEARRGGDLYRWGNTPVGDPILEAMYDNTPSEMMPVPLADRAICHPFSQTMIGTNPNL